MKISLFEKKELKTSQYFFLYEILRCKYIWLILTILYLRKKYVLWLTFLMLDKYLNGIQ